MAEATRADVEFVLVVVVVVLVVVVSPQPF